MMNIKEVLLLWFIKLKKKKKKTEGTGITTSANESAIKNKIKQNQQLGEKLHKDLFKNL